MSALPSHQLSFTWPPAVSYAQADFMVSEANSDATHFIDSWPLDMPRAGLLHGPESSGKTHLAHRWASRADTVFIDPAMLGSCLSEDLWQQRTFAVLEDIHAIADENALFHLLRHAENQRLHLLLTSRLLPRDLAFTLPDLQSRLRALITAQLHAPDDRLLKACVMKAFVDQQMRVSEEVITYLLARTERSFSGIRRAIEKIVQEQRRTHKTLTIPFLKSIL